MLDFADISMFSKSPGSAELDKSVQCVHVYVCIDEEKGVRPNCWLAEDLQRSWQSPEALGDITWLLFLCSRRLAESGLLRIHIPKLVQQLLDPSQSMEELISVPPLLILQQCWESPDKPRSLLKQLLSMHRARDT